MKNQVIEGGTKVNELIERTNIAEDDKLSMKVANNVTVNSSLLWGSN